MCDRCVACHVTLLRGRTTCEVFFFKQGIASKVAHKTRHGNHFMECGFVGFSQGKRGRGPACCGREAKAAKASTATDHRVSTLVGDSVVHTKAIASPAPLQLVHSPGSPSTSESEESEYEEDEDKDFDLDLSAELLDLGGIGIPHVRGSAHDDAASVNDAGGGGGLGDTLGQAVDADKFMDNLLLL